jgi:hypothetical protein
MTDCFNRLLSCGRCAVKVMPSQLLLLLRPFLYGIVSPH